MVYVVLIVLLNVLFMFPLLRSASRSDSMREQHIAEIPVNPEKSCLISLM